jgi:hypothetical protein
MQLCLGKVSSCYFDLVELEQVSPKSPVLTQIQFRMSRMQDRELCWGIIGMARYLLRPFLIKAKARQFNELAQVVV